jgi:two-component system OmpR family sensor kinase
MSIRLRITLFGVAVTSGVLALLCLAVYTLLAGGADETQDKELGERARLVAAGLASAPEAHFAAARPTLGSVDPRTANDIFVVVLDATGAPIASDGSVDGRAPTVPAAVLAGADANEASPAPRSGALAGTARGALATVDAAPGVPIRVFVLAWHRPDLNRSGYVVAGQSTRRVHNDRQVVALLIVVYTVLAFAFAVPAIWLVAGRALRPLRQLASHADEIGRSQDLSRRLPPVPTKDALGRLTTSFNAMMDRLEQAYRRVADSLAAQQRFTGDASHELRTPLTTIRNNAGFLLRHPDAEPSDRDAALRDIAGESERMSRLVDSLLALARADAGQPLVRAPVDLAPLAERVCRQVRTLHPEREIHCSATPTPPVSGDADALAQVLWILMDNAVKYTSTGGNVWVAVTQRGDLAQLHVSDDGPGIPPGESERIFGRFYRVDAARQREIASEPVDGADAGAGAGAGAGLGLSIAAWIVAEHGGTIMAANNARGGAAFVAEFPVATAAPADAV